MRRKFNKFPIPKYLSAKNNVIDTPARRPLLDFPKINEKVKSVDTKNIKKNSSSIHRVLGSVKRTISARKNHEKIVIMRAGKKLLCLFASSSLLFRSFFSLGDTMGI